MYEKYIKRLLDIVFSVLLLIIFSLPMAIIAFAVRVSIGSPVIFKQERPGRYEKIFTLYKFRTMTDGRDGTGGLLPDSERVTRIGKALRALSLDELPQLVNILLGQMSFVGPRPLLCEYLPLYNEEQRHRHDVRPGLTGLAQVNGRNALSWEEKFAYDIKYASSPTFFGDMRIIFKTVGTVFARKGITADGGLSPFSGNGNE